MATAFENMSFLDLEELRKAYPDPGVQRALAPYEHQAFAREYTQEYPVRALAGIGAVPAYQAAKVGGLLGSRSGTLDPRGQVRAGYRGMLQGYGALLRRGIEALLPSAQAAQPAAYNPEESASYTYGRSPIDRRGAYFGAPPIPPIASQQPPAKPPAGPGAVRPQQSMIPGFEREFGVINQQSGGAVPHQSIY